MGDTGLFVTALFADSQMPIEQSIYKQLIVDKLGINLGMVMENAIFYDKTVKMPCVIQNKSKPILKDFRLIMSV